MASTTELPDYPRGQITLEGGQLGQATMAKLTATNGGKLKHTLRKSPSGFVRGNREVNGSIEMEIDENGPERDYFAAVKSGKRKTFHFEIPGSTQSVIGAFTSLDLDMPLDDAVKISASFVGKLVDSGPL